MAAIGRSAEDDNSAEVPGQELQRLRSMEGETQHERNEFNCKNHPEPSGETNITSETSCCGNLSSKISNHPLRVMWILIVLSLLSIALIVAMSLQAHCSEHPQAPSAPFDPCPGSDWIFYLGRCYFFSEQESNWNSSQDFCLSHNGSLAKIKNGSPKEKAFVKRQIGIEAFWIGLKKVGESWKWLDGENATLKVTGGGASCAYFTDPQNMEASASKCSIKHRWICTSEPFKFFKKDQA